MRQDVTAAASLLLAGERIAVHLRREAPSLGFRAFGLLTVFQKPAPFSPINECLDQIAAIHTGSPHIEMVGGVLGVELNRFAESLRALLLLF
jgi:hypothetical protein